MNQTKSITIALLITLQVLVACSGDGIFPNPTPTPDAEAEAAEIYWLAIGESFGERDKYLINRTPGCLFADDHPKDTYQFEGVESEALADLFAKREHFKDFPGIIQADDRFILVDEQDFWGNIGSTDLPYSPQTGLSMDLLKQTYPWSDGIIHLSPVGFNQALSQAVVCIGLNSGGRGEIIHKIVFEKEEGTWIEVWHEIVTETA